MADQLDRSNWDEGTLLSGFSDGSLAKLAATWKVERFRQGALIFGDKDAGRDIYFLLRGVVRAAAFTMNGREVSFNVIRAGDCFGEIAAIDGGVRSSCVIAAEDVLIGRATSFDFQKLLEADSEMARAFLVLLCGKIRGMSDRLVEYTELTSPQRVRRELTRLARQHRTGPDSALITDMPTQSEIATQILARREAVAREMARMQRIEVIKRLDGGISVPSIRRLEAEVFL